MRANEHGENTFHYHKPQTAYLNIQCRCSGEGHSFADGVGRGRRGEVDAGEAVLVGPGDAQHRRREAGRLQQVSQSLCLSLLFAGISTLFSPHIWHRSLVQGDHFSC